MTETMRVLSLFFCSILLCACASDPVYKTNYDYIPPGTQSGRQCLTGCSTQKQSCSTDCSVAYQACQVDAEAKARSNLPHLQRQYEIELSVYLRERDLHQRELEAYDAKRDALETKKTYSEAACRQTPNNALACAQAENARRGLRELERPRYNIDRPSPPVLSEETQRIVQTQCDRECGCQNRYSMCFTACGGQIKETQICVENCDQE